MGTTIEHIITSAFAHPRGVRKLLRSHKQIPISFGDKLAPWHLVGITYTRKDQIHKSKTQEGIQKCNSDKLNEFVSYDATNLSSSQRLPSLGILINILANCLNADTPIFVP